MRQTSLTRGPARRGGSRGGASADLSLDAQLDVLLALFRGGDGQGGHGDWHKGAGRSTALGLCRDFLWTSEVFMLILLLHLAYTVQLFNTLKTLTLTVHAGIFSCFSKTL